MSDLISREALKKTFENACIYGLPMNELYGAILKIIDNAPTVDIKDEIAGAYNEGYMCGNKEAEKARPQGEWKETIYGFYTCSICGNYGNLKFFKFCPYCGADMRGEECVGHTIVKR